MPFYYYNESGEKIGPLEGSDLKRLARQGVITPKTKVEDENGKTHPAGNFPKLFPFYYFDKNLERLGPVIFVQIKRLAQSGEITRETIVENYKGETIIAREMPELEFPAPQPYPVSPPDPAPEPDDNSDPFKLKGVVSPEPVTSTVGTASLGYQTTKEPTQGAKSPVIFDILFTRFIVNIWIPVIWILVIGGHAFSLFMMELGIYFAADKISEGIGAKHVILPWLLLSLLVLLGHLFSLLYHRILLEYLIIVFRIETNTRTLKEWAERNLGE